MANKITWPINPTPGQIYTSPYGRTWVFENCVWVATCCPPENCDITVDGIDLFITTDFFDLYSAYVTSPFTIAIHFNYVGNYSGTDLWVSENQLGGSIQIRFSDGVWEIYDVSSGNVAGTLSGADPIGTWTSLFPGDLVTICGNNFPEICACLKQNSYDPGCFITWEFYPVIEGAGATSGNVAGYVSLQLPYWIVWDEGEWKFVQEAPGNDNILRLPGVPQDQPPVGTWEFIDGEGDGVQVTTTEGPCLCDPYSGTTLVLINGSSIDSKYLTYDGGVLAGDSGSWTITENSPGVWWLENNGNLIATSSNLIGAWVPFGAEYDTIYTVCGADPDYVGCLTIESDDYTVTFNYYEKAGQTFVTWGYEGGGFTPVYYYLDFNNGTCQWELHYVKTFPSFSDTVISTALPDVPCDFITPPVGLNWINNPPFAGTVTFNSAPCSEFQ
jgi:hypothetical protein